MVISATSQLIRSTNNLSNIKKGMDFLKGHAVLVGIPKEKNEREDSQIDNADLLFMHTHGVRRKSMRQEMQEQMDQGKAYSEAYNLYIYEHGSPLWQSPPRPVLEPAIKHDQAKIAEQLGKTVHLAFQGEFDRALAQFNRAGQVGQNAARAWFTNPENGWAPNSQATIDAKGSDRPLIDTDELRKSIIYIVRKRGET